MLQIFAHLQTQTLLQTGKSNLPVIKSTSIDVSQLQELKITETDDHKTEQRSSNSILQQHSVEIDASGAIRSDRKSLASAALNERSKSVQDNTSGEGPLVEVRSAAPPHPITPNTPKLAARYLQAVAAASGTPPGKPQVRVKPTVMKKPSVSPADSDTEQHQPSSTK